jgi:CheY-like chemotaxis protein
MHQETMDKPFALIVEDNRDIVALFQHVLDLAGYQTEIVMDGKEAMARIAARPPDIVLLDLQLPGMTGLDILKHMRTSERLSSIPIVVVTAFQNYTTGLPYQPDLVLLKPVNIHQLSNLVQKLQPTRGPARELAHDPITGLHNPVVFNERITSTLERVGQSSLLRFGVLFADVLKLDELRRRSEAPEMNSFLRGLADHFKAALRPTDTTAWTGEDGYLVALLEEIPTPEECLRIAARVQTGLNEYLNRQYLGTELRPIVGVLICDAEYKDVQKVMRDLALRRTLMRIGDTPSPAVFDHKVVLTQK